MGAVIRMFRPATHSTAGSPQLSRDEITGFDQNQLFALHPGIRWAMPPQRHRPAANVQPKKRMGG